MSAHPIRWFLAFSFLLLAVHEAHELAHAVAGRLICEEWPVRDFNAWRLTGPCASWWPTAAGPLFSYALMAIGVIVARRGECRWAGIALLFAANPFARIFTVVMGGGDEMVVAQRIAGVAARTPLLRGIVALFVLAICGSAIVAGWRALSHVPRRALWFTALLLWPMILTGTLLFAIGNRLLRNGVLADPVMTGAPGLVMLVSVASFVLAALTARWLCSTSAPPAATAPSRR